MLVKGLETEKKNVQLNMIHRNNEFSVAAKDVSVFLLADININLKVEGLQT